MIHLVIEYYRLYYDLWIFACNPTQLIMSDGGCCEAIDHQRLGINQLLIAINLTRKWAIPVRISHSTVCNMMVSTKKTRPTLGK